MKNYEELIRAGHDLGIVTSLREVSDSMKHMVSTLLKSEDADKIREVESLLETLNNVLFGLQNDKREKINKLGRE